MINVSDKSKYYVKDYIIYDEPSKVSPFFTEDVEPSM